MIEQLIPLIFSPDTLFLVFALFAIVFSLMVVLIPNPIYASLALIASFLPIAAIYILLHAPFIAVIQILVYAGAIMVLFTFVIMLIDLNPSQFYQNKPKTYLAAAIFLTCSLFISVPLITQNMFPNPTPPPPQSHISQFFQSQKHADQFGSTQKIGHIIFGKPHPNPKKANQITLQSPQLFSFELSSILIIVAIIGVMLLTRNRI